MSGCAGSQKKTTQQKKESTTMAADTVNTGNENYYGPTRAHYPVPIAVVSGQR